MSYELLERLSHLPLPQQFSGDDVGALKSYLAARLIDAKIQAAQVTRVGFLAMETAMVLKLTTSGRKTLERKDVCSKISNFTRSK